MEWIMWVIWVFVFLLGAMAVLILIGRGDFLLFNKKKDPKERYHVKRARLTYGLAFGVMAGLMAYLALFDRQMDPGLRSWWSTIIMTVFLAASILRVTVCRK